jgi:hypothetical protein
VKRKEPAVIAIDTTESIAAQFLGLLLDGHRVDRKSALTTELGKSGWNQSLHVLANYLRWTRLIPVESDMEENHPRATYWMTPTEIRRFRDPVGRLEQEAEMLAERTAKRLRNNAKSVQRLAALVRECPDDARLMHSVLREATDELTRAVLSL